MIADSPFQFHGPLDPGQVFGREEIVADLIARVSARRPTVLVAPRRFGKTSILGRIGAELADTTTVIKVDLYELRSWADFATRIDSALGSVRGSARSGLDKIAASVEIKLGILKASFSRPDRPEPDIVADRLLDVIVQHAATTPTVLIFDEFSSITRVDGAAGMLRTKLQHHFSEIGLLFAGSEPSTMAMLFSQEDQPFYAQADLIGLPGLSLDLVTELIADGFDQQPPPGLAAEIFNFTGGHPQRTMQLADAAWRAKDSGTPVDGVWASALAMCQQTVDAGQEIRFSAMSPAEQAVMRLAANGSALHGRDAELLSLSSTSALRAKAKLVDRGQIQHTDNGGVEVVDPLFADWIRRRFTL